MGDAPNPRARTGAQNGRAKLTEAQVAEIRQTVALHPEDRGAALRLAERFGVHHTTVYRVLRGWTWGATEPDAPCDTDHG